MLNTPKRRIVFLIVICLISMPILNKWFMALDYNPTEDEYDNINITKTKKAILKDVLQKNKEEIVSMTRKYLNMFPDTPINSDDVLYNYKHYEMTHAPTIKYVENLKNPCFIADDKKVGTRLCCVPSFFLLGFPKGGTTDLYARINMHQQVVKTTKKTTFWSPKSNLKYPFETYTEMFQRTSRIILKGTLNGSRSDMVNVITGDFFQDNMYRGYWEKDPSNIVNTSTGYDVLPNILTPHRIKHILPNAKFLITIRDPIVRMISDYNHLNELHDIPIGSDLFDNVAKKGIAWFKNCTTKFGYSVKRCVFGEIFPDLKIPTKLPSLVRRGIYSEYIKPWLEVFPRSQFVFIKFDDYRKNPMEYLEQNVFPFLGIDGYAPDIKETILKWQNEKKIINKSVYDVKPWESTLQLLRDFYQSFNKDLVDILGSDFDFTYT